MYFEWYLGQSWWQKWWRYTHDITPFLAHLWCGGTRLGSSAMTGLPACASGFTCFPRMRDAWVWSLDETQGLLFHSPSILDREESTSDRALDESGTTTMCLHNEVAHGASLREHSHQTMWRLNHWRWPTVHADSTQAWLGYKLLES